MVVKKVCNFIICLTTLNYDFFCLLWEEPRPGCLLLSSKDLWRNERNTRKHLFSWHCKVRGAPITPWGWRVFFGPYLFITLKTLHHHLSIEGSNFFEFTRTCSKMGIFDELYILATSSRDQKKRNSWFTKFCVSV